MKKVKLRSTSALQKEEIPTAMKDETEFTGEGQVDEIMFYDENYLPEIKYCIFNY